MIYHMKKIYLTFEKHVTNSKIILNIEMKICGKCFVLKSPYRLVAIGIRLLLTITFLVNREDTMFHSFCRYFNLRKDIK